MPSETITKTCVDCNTPKPLEDFALEVGAEHGRRATCRICANIGRRYGARPLVERFWEKVDKDGPIPESVGGACWLWTRHTNGVGYGLINVDGEKRLATHVSWMIEHGAWPLPSLFICHRCDTPRCVRPDHLFIGAPKTNTGDMLRKGRHPHGTDHKCSLLTEEQVRDARRRYAAGVPLEDIARDLPITKAGLHPVVTGRYWSHITDVPGIPAKPRACLTAEDVREIRLRHAAGEQQTALAAAFRVSTAAVYAVVHRKTWKHVA